MASRQTMDGLFCGIRRNQSSIDSPVNKLVYANYQTLIIDVARFMLKGRIKIKTWMVSKSYL